MPSSGVVGVEANELNPMHKPNKIVRNCFFIFNVIFMINFFVISFQVVSYGLRTASFGLQILPPLVFHFYFYIIFINTNGKLFFLTLFNEIYANCY